MAVEELKKLPLGQAKFLLKLIKNEGICFAESKSEGGSAKELLRKKWIEPLGKISRRIRWRLIKDFSRKKISALLDIVFPNAREGVIRAALEQLYSKQNQQKVQEEALKILLKDNKEK